MRKKVLQKLISDREMRKGELKSFLDTSVTIKQSTGHSKHKSYLSNAILEPRYVNNYVRMEFYRALLMSWISLYFEAGSPFHSSFSDALLFCSDRFGREPKSFLTAIGNMMANVGFDVGAASEKQDCLHKLEDIIFEVAYSFELAYKEVGVDPTECARVQTPLRVSSIQDRQDTLLEFEGRFSDTESCRTRCSIQKLFQADRYAEQMKVVERLSQDEKAHVALKKMTTSIKKGSNDTAKLTCSTCNKIGDIVIAISMPAGWKMHSLDSVHEPICQALGKEVCIHPSAAALKKSEADNH